MALSTVHLLACIVTVLAVTSARKDQTRWSRQISSYTADIGDWIPLPGPAEDREDTSQIKRQAVAEPRILTEPFPSFSRATGFGQDMFPVRTYFGTPANRQLYLQSMPAVPSAPQNYLSEQGFGQSIRFGLSQPNFPLTQGFVSPQLGFENVQQVKARPQPTPSNTVKFENYPKTIPVAAQAKPFISQQVPNIKDAPKFIDGYRAENTSSDFSYSTKKKPQSLHKIKFENTDSEPKIATIPQGNAKVEREEVQLLYVPLEQLNRGQFNFRSPITSPQILNTDLYSQGSQRPNTLKQTLSNEFQRPLSKPTDNISSQDFFNNYNVQKEDLGTKYSTAATPFPTLAPAKPKKLKPHQPPLAIFLTQEASRNNQVKVGDVLSSLKSASTVAVLDSVNPLNSPSVFIGPSNLKPPEKYVKFELPYLSNIENSDKKLRQLPFFVAPLSYNTPQGFAKIPFPSPHVGSVVINAQIKETTTAPIKPASTAKSVHNVYTQSPTYNKQEPNVVTQKPTVSFYSTAPPRVNAPPNYQSNYYSFEPQSVSTVRPLKEPEASIATVAPKPGSYFMSNIGNQYNPIQFNPSQYNPSQYVTFPQEQRYKVEPFNAYNIQKETESTTTTTTTTTPQAPQHSTYPSQLLETHNPYSINQAFHFSTPLDYHSYFDEPFATPKTNEFNQVSPSLATHKEPSPAPHKTEEFATEKNTYQQQSSPNYLQNYSPEIHYENEDQNSRRPSYSPSDYTTKPELSSEIQSASPVNTEISVPISSSNPTYTEELKPETPVIHQSITDEINKLHASADVETVAPKYEYNQYETNYEEDEPKPTTPTTTTTTRRNALRTRGRPRSTTTPRPESNEYSTRNPITRKPWGERRPLPTRARYEPNKITSEKPTRKPLDSNESTTKSSRARTRGRIHYKPSESDDGSDRRYKPHNKKEEDLAYQRDVLHQNYPVTLMERTSTVDIEAITEPSPKISFTENLATETFDAENAYTNEKPTITQHFTQQETNDDIHVPTFTSRSVQTESPFVEETSPSRYNEYVYQSRSSLAPVDVISYDTAAVEKEDQSYDKPTTPAQEDDTLEVQTRATEPVNPVTEQGVASYSENNEVAEAHQEESTTLHDYESPNDEQNLEEQENVVQTTPSYNRVRVRPGVIRQYHQASSTESSRSKIERRKPLQAITYRPAFDRRRTTMRIEEIEADLKTKQVHARPDVQDYRHPIYKPEPNTEPPVTSTQTTTTKRGQFRRRRPNYSYSTTTTESASSKRTYEVKNRFRGRRPTTEKPTEKPEVQAEPISTTVRSSPHSRYSHRPRLSERYNKKPEPEETEDQDSNYSINRPKYAEPETDQWSPKISSDSFKPYNPNGIVDDQKTVTTEVSFDNDEMDIITARNEFDDILISVTPATNTRNNKKLPEIPPTLEALVERSKVTKSEAGDTMSTFETMLEEVMKSLEEQDENEYTSNVMKHKGGEIGEIPPERIISSGDYLQKTTMPIQLETTTDNPSAGDSANEDDRKGRRRGFWKKVKVRPVTTEAIDAAESQYYPHTLNHVGQPVQSSKSIHEKSEKNEKPLAVTTYKPTLHKQFSKDIFTSDDEDSDMMDVVPTVELSKITTISDDEILQEEESQTTIAVDITPTEKNNFSPGDLDLGTGSPDPTVDETYYVTSTESTTPSNSITNRSDAFSIMDYLFGITTKDGDLISSQKNITTTPSTPYNEAKTEQVRPVPTTESTYIPEEITTMTTNEENTDRVLELELEKVNKDENAKFESATEKSIVKVESSSVSSFMNPINLVSTSMSTEISHETEICFRGKCIKTSKDIL